MYHTNDIWHIHHSTVRKQSNRLPFNLTIDTGSAAESLDEPTYSVITPGSPFVNSLHALIQLLQRDWFLVSGCLLPHHQPSLDIWNAYKWCAVMGWSEYEKFLCVLLFFIKPILGNRYVRSRDFIVREPRETHPRSEIADAPTSPCPPLDNLRCPDSHPPS